MSGANPWRGEASLIVGGAARRLRPTFAALVAAEEELGPLLAVVERAAAGNLRLGEIVVLFWHCLAERDSPNHERISREDVGAAVVATGLAGCAAPLRSLLGQILQGGG